MVRRTLPGYSFTIGNAPRMRHAALRAAPPGDSPPQEGDMTSKRNTVNDRIDRMATSAKRTAAKASAAKERAATAATKQVHEAGKRLRDAGEKIMKQADGR
jgi:hypothetical protein